MSDNEITLTYSVEVAIVADEGTPSPSEDQIAVAVERGLQGEYTDLTVWVTKEN